MPTSLTDLDLANQALRQFGDDALATFPEAGTRRGQIIAQYFTTVRDATLQAHPWNFAIVRTVLYAYTEPAATLTPGATTGTGITFTASAAVFTATDVGKTLEGASGSGVAEIVSVTDASHVVADITQAFASVAAIAAGDWRLYNAAPAWGFARTILLPGDCLRVWRVDESIRHQVEGQTLVTDEAELSLRYIAQITDPTLWTPLFAKAFVAHLAAEIAEPITGQVGKGDRAWQKYQGFLRQARTMDGMEGSAERLRSRPLIDVRHFGA